MNDQRKPKSEIRIKARNKWSVLLSEFVIRATFGIRHLDFGFPTGFLPCLARSVKQTRKVRRFCLIVGLWICGLLAGTGLAETFRLNNGQTISGELLAASASDAGVQIKKGEGEYERVPWANFSQEDLKQFAQNKKLEPLVEPFIEVSQEEKIKKTEVKIKEPPRLERPPAKSLLGALLASGPGFLILLLLYAANVYAGYEVAIFRAQSVPLVCGVSAVLPVIGPIIFLSMPTRIQPAEVTWETAPAAETAEAVNPMQVTSAEHPTGLKLAHSEAEHPAPGQPQATVFQRGQFTFNRRFFETKFPGFFGVVRRDADRDMVLLIKSARGQYAGQRISRIAANDLHLEVHKGNASEEVMIPFTEIQEIRLQHKDAA